MAAAPSSSIGGVIHSLGIEFVGLGFQSCDSDCVGAAVTDAALAVHAMHTALRIARHVKQERAACSTLCETRTERRTWPFATIAIGQILSNCGWSVLGACYWLQPSGYKYPGFEFVWRLSAQCQVSLFYFAYCIGLAFNRIGGCSAFVAKHELLLSRIGLAHALAFGIVCLSPQWCLQHEYVLWGGLNILFPLLSQWLVIVFVALRHGMHRTGWTVEGSRLPHPLLLAAISGSVFWVGNTGIILGRHAGLARWIRHAIGALVPITESEAWEEMATFHIFGLLGNDLLWRGYEWVAVTEVRIEAAARRAAAPEAAALLSGARLSATELPAPILPPSAEAVLVHRSEPLTRRATSHSRIAPPSHRPIVRSTTPTLTSSSMPTSHSSSANLFDGDDSDSQPDSCSSSGELSSDLSSGGSEKDLVTTGAAVSPVTTHVVAGGVALHREEEKSARRKGEGEGEGEGEGGEAPADWLAVLLEARAGEERPCAKRKAL